MCHWKTSMPTLHHTPPLSLLHTHARHTRRPSRVSAHARSQCDVTDGSHLLVETIRHLDHVLHFYCASNSEWWGKVRELFERDQGFRASSKQTVNFPVWIAKPWWLQIWSVHSQENCITPSLNWREWEKVERWRKRQWKSVRGPRGGCTNQITEGLVEWTDGPMK